jgi:WD repeat-containing protein 61
MMQCLFLVDAWTLAFSPDSRFLATGSHSGKINIFGVDSGRKEMTMDTRGKFTLSIAYVDLQIYFLICCDFPHFL